MNKEQTLIASLIFSTKANRELQKIGIELYSGILQSQAAKYIATWCIDYVEKYTTAPGPTIQKICNTYLESEPDKAEYKLANKLIQTITTEYTIDDNWEYLLDGIFQHIKEKQFEKLKANIEICLSKNDVSSAEELLTVFKTAKREKIEGISLKQNELVAKIVTDNSEDETILTFPGALGQLVGDLQRGDLFAVASPAKRGKSWFLQESAIRAALQKKVVVYYSLEMNEKQVLSRIAQQLTNEIRYLPHDSEVDDSGTTYKNVILPTFDGIDAIRQNNTRKYGMNRKLVADKLKKFDTMSGRGDIHVCCFPAYSADVKRINQHLDELEREKNIIPDVIVVDYADILLSSNRQDYRHQIDLIWKSLRGLAQERSVLCITASHTNKSTYSKSMGQGDLAEDTRKLNHVSCMIGMNQSNQDKENFVWRAVSLANRHGAFNSADEVVILHNFEIGRTYIDSRWMKEIGYDPDKKQNSLH